jgi:ADP-L-glycero-D-manno-heptose 6-epimerase
MRNKTIVVTGAAGMIGSCAIRHLNDLGYTSILAVDNLKTGAKWKNLLGKQFFDIIGKEALFDWLKERGGEVGAILHLGACSSTVETDVDYLLENNFRYTIRLADWALENNVRFVYASSAATYGDGLLGFDDEEERIEELKPLNPYGFSKQLADLWMKQQGVLKKVVGLKYFNIFGPNEYHKGNMASMPFKMSKIEGPIRLFKSNDKKYEDGGQMRDFLYVKDAVKMTCQLLFSSHGGIFNIGMGQPTTWNVLADALCKALLKKTDIAYIDMPADLARQYQNYTCARMTKFEKLFGLKTTPIGEAVQDYVQNYLITEARW